MRTEGPQETLPTTPQQRRAGTPATRAFIGLAVVFYVLGLAGLEESLLRNLAQINPLIEAGEWWRLFTPVLLHGTLMHLLFNMWALWVLGPQVERGVGTWPFVGLYLASAAVGGAFFFYFGSGAWAVGASGAIFGLFGIWLNWAMHRRRTVQGQALLRQIGFLLLINAALPLFVNGIAWQAHLGGFIAGFVIGEVWSRLRGGNAEAMRVVVALGVAVLAVISVLI